MRPDGLSPRDLSTTTCLSGQPCIDYPILMVLTKDPGLGDTTVGSADPCVTSVVDHGSYVTITVLSTHASTWSEVAATSDRVAGVDRFGTAIATSQLYLVPGQATAAVLARDDGYADALTGGSLASAKGGPLLLSDLEALPAAVAAELTRALVPGSSVYLLGGTSALSPSLEQSVTALGFTPVRIAGPDRYATAVAVAEALGNPSTVLLASGVDFPDALAAGAAAAHTGAAVLLTAGTAQPAATARYLADPPGITLYAIGGPAAPLLLETLGRHVDALAGKGPTWSESQEGPSNSDPAAVGLTSSESTH